MAISVLSRICLSFLISPPPLIKEYFVKLAVRLVVEVVGSAVAMDFFACFSAFKKILFASLFFSLGERWGEHLPELLLPLNQNGSIHLPFLVV